MSSIPEYPISTIAYLPHPPGETAATKAGVDETNLAVTSTNKKLLTAVGSLAKADPTIGLVRFAVIIVIVFITVIGSFSLLAAINQSGSTSTGSNTAGIVVSGSIVAIALIYAGLTNPLQTVERDIVYRRWSDMIVNVYFAELSGNGDPEKAGAAASLRFAALAASYSALASKNGEILAEMAHLAAPQHGGTADTPTQLTVENPGPQSAVAGATIDGFSITATGPGTLSYAQTGLPDGLTLDPTGKVTGTAPKETKNYPVTVTVTSDAAGTGSASVGFTLDVTAPPNPGGPVKN